MISYLNGEMDPDMENLLNDISRSLPLPTLGSQQRLSAKFMITLQQVQSIPIFEQQVLETLPIPGETVNTPTPPTPSTPIGRAQRFLSAEFDAESDSEFDYPLKPHSNRGDMNMSRTQLGPNNTDMLTTAGGEANDISEPVSNDVGALGAINHTAEGLVHLSNVAGVNNPDISILDVQQHLIATAFSLTLEQFYMLEVSRQEELQKMVIPPNKPFKCPVIGCPKGYLNKGGLRYHGENGHKDQRLGDNGDGTLSIINPQTGTPYTGTVAMETAKPFMCPGCKNGYKSPNGLKQHRDNSLYCLPEALTARATLARAYPGVDLDGGILSNNGEGANL